MDNYTVKKKNNQELISKIKKHISESSLELIEQCGSFLEMYSNKELDKKKLKTANFCKNRFCPMCNWRKSKKDALKVSILMQYIKEELGLEFVFITLTAPNVKGEELEQEIREYTKAFSNLTKRKEFIKVNKGFVRKLEVTYNEENNTYHPHLHIIMAVNKSYFTDKTYISKKKLLELWKECKKDNTITQVDIKKVDTTDRKAILEIAKYSAKDSDYLKSQEVFDVFYKALKGKRLLTYTGVFKDAIDLFEEGKLDKYKEVDLTEYVYLITYNWNKENAEYIVAELKELSEEEKRLVNKKLIEELEEDG